MCQDAGGEGGGADGHPGGGDAARQGGTIRTRLQLCGDHTLQIYGIPSGLALFISNFFPRIKPNNSAKNS